MGGGFAGCSESGGRVLDEGDTEQREIERELEDRYQIVRTAVALLVSAIPARRAAAADPMESLRAE